MESWTSASQNLSQIFALVKIDSTISAASDNGVVLSTDNGTSWFSINNALTNKEVRALVTQGSNIFAGTSSDGVFLSSDNGMTWSSINNGLSDLKIVSLITKGSYIIAGTKNEGIFLSSNSGQNWISINSGLTNHKIETLYINDSSILAGFYCGSIWWRPLSEITSVERPLNDLPEHFSLEQNYPNPFNPTTTIKYSVLKESFVIIKIYNVLGKEINTLVNERKSEGNYTINFNATNLPSGVYFYRMQAGSFVSTKKFVLLK